MVGPFDFLREGPSFWTGHFHDSTSTPRMVCFVCVDFDVCFPLQPYAFFQQVNCSEPKPYLLRATTACNFLISHPTRWLCTRSFSEPTFRPSGATKHWQNTVIRDFFTVSRTLLFFLLTYSLLWSSFFSLSLLWLFPPLLLHLSTFDF